MSTAVTRTFPSASAALEWINRLACQLGGLGRLEVTLRDREVTIVPQSGLDPVLLELAIGSLEGSRPYEERTLWAAMPARPGEVEPPPPTLGETKDRVAWCATAFEQARLLLDAEPVSDDGDPIAQARLDRSVRLFYAPDRDAAEAFVHASPWAHLGVQAVKLGAFIGWGSRLSHRFGDVSRLAKTRKI